MTDLVYPDDIDTALNWPIGTVRRMARRRRLPHYLLPDGEIRFRLDEVMPLIQRVAAAEGGQQDAGAAEKEGRSSWMT